MAQIPGCYEILPQMVYTKNGTQQESKVQLVLRITHIFISLHISH